MKFVNTPVIKYGEIYVKREDLCLKAEKDDLEIPGLAKLRGAWELLSSLKEQGYKNIGIFDTRVSKAGWGIACICKQLELTCYCYFPLLKGSPLAKQQIMSAGWGGKLRILKGGRTAVLYSQAKKDFSKIEKGYFLPLGLVCKETVLSVAEVSSKISKYGTIVVSTGTGTIMAGILAGITQDNMPQQVIGVSCGMNLVKQKKRMLELLKEVKQEDKQDLMRLEMADREYYQPDNIKTPFPSHPYYDKKAWHWLLRNEHSLVKPILFWNIGR